MKKLLFVLIAIAVLVGVIVIVAIPMVNNRVSTLLGDTLKDQIALQGLEENIAYDSITVDSINGRVTVQGLVVQDFNFVGKILIDGVTATVPVKDIVSLARSLEDGAISDVHLAITGVEMAMKVEGVDVALDVGTSEVQVNGRLDMNFIQNLLAGSVEPGIPQIDLIRLGVDRAELNSSDVTLSLGSLLAEVETVENAESESVSSLNISMAKVKVDGDIGGENTTTIVLDRYETQVQGAVVLELIAGLVSGNIEIDTSLIDSMSIDLEGGEFHVYDDLSDGESYINLGTLTAGLHKVKNETIDELHAAMTDVQMGFEVDGEKTSLSLGRSGIQVEGQKILDLLDEFATGDSGVDTVAVDTIRMDFERAALIAPELSMSIGSFMATLDGVESVLALRKNNSAITPQLHGEVNLNDYILDLDGELLEGFLADLEMTVGPVPFLRDPESWKVDNLQGKLSLENEKAKFSDLALTTSWLDISGSSSLGFSKGFVPSPPFEADIRVAQYPEELRPLLEIMTVVLFDTNLPKDNAFTVQISDESIRWGNI